MPKISHNSLLNLTAFRQKNSLLQQDIANYLGVSRGYISMVEKGASKLSRENIDKLFDAKKTLHWDPSDLVPAYTRLNAALEYINGTLNEKRRSVGIQPLYYTMDPTSYSKIKYGEIDVGEYIIEDLLDTCPELNADWLLFGQGEMLNEATIKRETEIEALKIEIQNLRKEFASFQSELLRRLKETRDQIIESLKE